ncbi:MAG: metallophosphoesterase [Clostridia bacterium]|nr:metallophosphoesterase [Clostridia bacterium]
MQYEILTGSETNGFEGCDFVVRLPADRKNTKIRVLQLTDMQIIDASQRRTPDRLRPDEIAAWDPGNFDAQCGNHIRSLIAQSRPDLIILTGDIVYGSFDDSGSTLEWFCTLMDSLAVPWAPVYGNHDNESRMGVTWQCEQFEKSPYCLFRRGTVSGNSNYTVGIAAGNELIRVIHMLDSNGCGGSADPSVIKTKGICKDQLEMIGEKTVLITRAQKRRIPAFMAFHIPIDCFEEAERKYRTGGAEYYTIGVDVPAYDGDFGFKLEKYRGTPTEEGIYDFLHEQGIDGVFAGHVHNDCTSITYENIRWVFGLKTGQYDYHIPGQVGGTLITLENEDFSVTHLPSLVHYAPMPGGAGMFEHFFADSTN